MPKKITIYRTKTALFFFLVSPSNSKVSKVSHKQNSTMKRDKGGKECENCKGKGKGKGKGKEGRKQTPQLTVKHR